MSRKGDAQPKRSPAMEQYFRAKAQHPDAILFFRLGDFYEMFYEDAVLVSQLIDLTLTSRSKDKAGESIPMAGLPHHAAAGYIARLLALGQRVAICEQMGDPSKIKGLVPREVVRVVSPGLVLDPDALDARAPNYLVALCVGGEPLTNTDGAAPNLGLAALELTTSELRACIVRDQGELLSELVRLDPRELITCGASGDLLDHIAQSLPRAVVRKLPDAAPDAAESAAGWQVLVQEAGSCLDPIGRAGGRAAALAFAYAQDAQPNAPLRVRRIAPYDPSAQLVLDDAAVRSLELVRLLSGERKGSLLDWVDMTSTAMGARLLRQRILAPSTEVATIRRRHDRVETLRDQTGLRTELRAALARVHDLERLTTRVSLRLATPRDLAAIGESLSHVRGLAQALDQANQTSAEAVLPTLPTPVRCESLEHRLRDALVDQPPMTASSGGIFRGGYDSELDELKGLSSSSKDVLLQLEQRERERTGIGSLKIRYTRVFGYYIEVTRSQLKSVPADYRRKQTIAGGERYTTEELDALQERILHADERATAREHGLFEALRDDVARCEPQLRELAALLADLDVHLSFAEAAHRFAYTRPQVDDSLCLELRDARHPVVERNVPAGEFVPNDVCLDVDGERLMIITGPNMAGKSTTMRQVALAVILAQAGGFVPAAHARIGVVDRLYTRVGASDDLSRGQSTFMLEMKEAANILRGATRRSLVILDEIGRGTSTYDGLAIAWAIAEYLHDVIACRAMFATHYHELCALADAREGLANYNVAAKQYRDQMVFLRKLVRGGANRSYGVEVARLAGLPQVVLARAKARLRELEQGESSTPSQTRDRHGHAAKAGQLELSLTPAHPPSEAEGLLRELDVERMTPVDALVTLAQLKALVTK